MVGYKKAEKEMIDAAKDFYLEHGPGKVIEKVKATSDTKKVLDFYHDIGQVKDSMEHHIYWDILKKIEDPKNPVVTHEEISKAKAKAEKEHLIRMKEENDIRAAEALDAEIIEKQAELEKRKDELVAKREAKLKALEAEKERLEKEEEEINSL